MLNKCDLQSTVIQNLPTLPTQCPSCQGALWVAKLRCPECATQVEGDFELPGLLRLPVQDLQFVTSFVKVSGSLKEMSKLQGQSYPTIRNRLNEIISRVVQLEKASLDARHAVLDAIATGTLSVAEGAKKLREVKA
jgi:hypothetical protein